METAVKPQKTYVAPNADGTKRGELIPVSPEDERSVRDASRDLMDFADLCEYLNKLCDAVF